MDKDKENQAQHAGMNSLQAAFKGSLYTQSSGSDKVLCVWLFICVEVNTVSNEGITHRWLHRTEGSFLALLGQPGTDVVNEEFGK